MADDRPLFPPYRPSPSDGRDWDEPLSAQEQRMADHLFKIVRYLAKSIDYAGTFRGPKSKYVVAVHFDEGQPPEARVHVIYDCAEFSSGYREDGVGPDLGTALSRLSDDDDTNGTAALKEE